MYATKQNTLLFALNEFYNSDRKYNIGHGSSHVFGVMKRSLQRYYFINENPEFKDVLTEPISKDIIIATAVLHDVGNVINRKNHNQFSKGIVQGYLHIDDILNEKTPIYNELDKQTRNNLKSFILDSKMNNDGLFNEYYHFENINSIIPDKESQEALFNAMLIKFQFDSFYNQEFNYEYINSFDKYLSNHFCIPKDSYLYESIKKYSFALFPESKKIIETARDEKKYEIERSNKEKITAFNERSHKYSEKCRKLTEMLHASYSQSELKIIADAVQEHNVDFKYKDECIDSINNTEQAQKEAYKQNRFQGSSIYSMIIADADKDNFIETSIMRRFLFSKNHSFIVNQESIIEASHINEIKHLLYKNEAIAIVPMLSCAFNILGQFYQRDRKESSSQKLLSKIPEEILNCSTDGENVLKKIDVLQGMLEIYKENYSNHTFQPSYLKYDRYYYREWTSSVDTYSQLNTFFKTTVFSELNGDYDKKADVLGDFTDTENFQHALAYVLKVSTDLLKSNDTMPYDQYINEKEAEMYKGLYLGQIQKENLAISDPTLFIQEEQRLDLQQVYRTTTIQKLSESLKVDSRYFAVCKNKLYLNPNPNICTAYNDSILIGEFDDSQLTNIESDIKNISLIQNQHNLYTLYEDVLSENIDRIKELQALDDFIFANHLDDKNFYTNILLLEPWPNYIYNMVKRRNPDCDNREDIAKTLSTMVIDRITEMKK